MVRISGLSVGCFSFSGTARGYGFHGFSGWSLGLQEALGFKVEDKRFGR